MNLLDKELEQLLRERHESAVKANELDEKIYEKLSALGFKDTKPFRGFEYNGKILTEALTHIEYGEYENAKDLDNGLEELALAMIALKQPL